MARVVRWGQLVTASGLAAAITAAGGFVSDWTKSGQARRTQQCEIASQLLQDESPTPYLDAVERDRVYKLAMQTIEHCLAR